MQTQPLRPAAPARDGRPPEASEVTRIFLRPMGSPMPLGFVGLAGASILASGIQLGWVNHSQQALVGLLLLVFPVGLEIIASIFGFLLRDTVAGTGMGVLGATWAVIGVTFYVDPHASSSHALGLLLFVSTAVLLAPAAAAAQGKGVPAAVLFVAALRYCLTGVATFAGHGWADASGWTGVALCALTIYAILALDLENMKRQTVLPLLRRGRGREAIEDGMGSDLYRIDREPGVREQL